jgi:hypothetical protein
MRIREIFVVVVLVIVVLVFVSMCSLSYRVATLDPHKWYEIHPGMTVHDIEERLGGAGSVESTHPKILTWSGSGFQIKIMLDGNDVVIGKTWVDGP